MPVKFEFSPSAKQGVYEKGTIIKISVELFLFRTSINKCRGQRRALGQFYINTPGRRKKKKLTALITRFVYQKRKTNKKFVREVFKLCNVAASIGRSRTIRSLVEGHSFCKEQRVSRVLGKCPARRINQVVIEISVNMATCVRNTVYLRCTMSLSVH